MIPLRLSTILLVAAAVALCGCQSNPVLRKRGLDALADGQLTRAEAHLTKAIDQAPTDWRAYFYLGKVFLRADRNLDAQLSLEKALALAPDGHYAAVIIDDLAAAHFKQGDYKGLAVLLKKVCDANGKSYDFRRQGNFLAQMGDPDGAIRALRKAAKFAPEDVQPYVDMANLYKSMGDRTREIESLRRAYMIKPNNPQVNKRLQAYGQVPGPTAGLHPQD